jgi:hypothetical protein
MTREQDIRILPDGDPEPILGSVRFDCRCGFVIDSADFPPPATFRDRDRYAEARKAHKDACPMRHEPPWPFDRLPLITRTLLGGASGPSTLAGAAGEPALAGAPRPPRFRPLASAPAWVRRRWAVVT